MCLIFFRVGRRVFGLASYYILSIILGTRIEYYIQLVFLIHFLCEKICNIYKRFKRRTNTQTCKLLRLRCKYQRLRLNITPNQFFLLRKEKTYLMNFERKESTWTCKLLRLGSNTRDQDCTLHQTSFFNPLLLKMVKVFKLVVLNLFEKRA